MNRLNHLRKQCTDTFIDEILEEMYRILVIQIQPKFLLKLYTKKLSWLYTQISLKLTKKI